MSTEIRYPKTVVIDGVEYKIGDKVPMVKKRRRVYSLPDDGVSEKR